MPIQTTVICAVWHREAQRHELLQSHQANLDRQSIQVERIYVFDNQDAPPPGLRGTAVVVSEKLSVYQAWNVALALVQTPYVMNLNLDDRLAPDGVAILEGFLESNPEVFLVGGDWRICYSQEETEAVTQALPIKDFPVPPNWPPIPGTLARLGSGDGKRGTLGPACLWRMAAHLHCPRYPWRFNDGTLIYAAADSIWWQLLIKHLKKKVRRLPLVIGNYFSHPDAQAEFRCDTRQEIEKARTGGVSLL